MKKFNVREFTEIDWYMIGGAERFDDGHEPWVFDDFKYAEGTIIIADQNGLQIIVDENEYRLQVNHRCWNCYLAKNIVSTFLKSIESFTGKEIKLYLDILNFEKRR